MLIPKRNPLVYWPDSIEKSSWSGCIIVYVQILSHLKIKNKEFFFFYTRWIMGIEYISVEQQKI